MHKRMVGTLLSVSLLLFSACGQSVSKPPVHITLMHGWGGSAADHVAMRRIFDDFAKENPDIALEYDASPDILNVIKKANNMLAVGKVPDIISTNGSGFVENARKRGLALNLAPYLAADSAFADSISDSTRQTWTDQTGAIYTLPDAQEYVGYWYNKDAFRRAGITDTGTPEGKIVPPRTWKACDAIAAREAETGIKPMMMQSDQLAILLGARLAAGHNQSRDFMQHNARTSRKQDVEAAVMDLQRAIAYHQDPQLSALDARDMFFSGKSAIYINGVWASSALAQSQSAQHIGYALFPSDNGESVSFVTANSGYVIGNTASQEQIDASVRFLKYMLSEKVQKRLVEETGQAPSNPTVRVEWMEEHAPRLGRVIRNCAQADVQISSLRTILSEKQNAELVNALNGLLADKNTLPLLISILADNGVTR